MVLWDHSLENRRPNLTMSKDKILVIGANGQIGSVLVTELRNAYGNDQVVSSDIWKKDSETGPFEIIGAMDAQTIAEVVDKHQIKQVYHLAAILSAKGENNPQLAWDINMNSLMHVFEVAREKGIKRIFFPGSIAVFGDNAPKINTPQDANLSPSTVYGISKVAGELWSEYYFLKFGLDVRSLRYPGVIGYQSNPGGGTTDYAVDIFHSAVKREPYTCFLKAKTALPMIYMEDAIQATIRLMEAPSSNISVRTSYNLSSISFTPSELADCIKAHEPDFQIIYEPDKRQLIAESWPESIDDKQARMDWGWEPAYDIQKMTSDMIFQLRKKYGLLENSLV